MNGRIFLIICFKRLVNTVLNVFWWMFWRIRTGTQPGIRNGGGV